jgi:hypothetical protein
MSVSDRTWHKLIDTDVGSRENRLYGGSQYHRTLREFNLATRCLRAPTIADDEIANAVGMGESHDGVNFLHAACSISLEKARTSFEPLLNTLASRMTHVMDRVCPITEYMLRETRERNRSSTSPSSSFAFSVESRYRTHTLDHRPLDTTTDISQNPQFRQLIRTIYSKFVRHCADSVSIVNVADICKRIIHPITILTSHILPLVLGNESMPRRLDSHHEICYMVPK